MTDKTKCLLVTLDDEYRIDDIESNINALKMIKGVHDVQPVKSGPEDFFNKIAIKNQIKEELWESFFKIFNNINT